MSAGGGEMARLFAIAHFHCRQIGLVKRLIHHKAIAETVDRSTVFDSAFILISVACQTDSCMIFFLHPFIHEILMFGNIKHLWEYWNTGLHPWHLTHNCTKFYAVASQTRHAEVFEGTVSAQ